MNEKVIVICVDSFDGIMTGIYKAWSIKNKQEKAGSMNVELVAGEAFNYEMFAEYIHIQADALLSEKVVKSIRKTFSWETYTRVYNAAMSCHKDKADIIFHFLIDAYRIGYRINEYLNLKSVMDLFELDRNVMREQHHYLGFVRFMEIDNKFLLSTITPKNNILTLIAPHFSDRLSLENWIIYDKNRKLAVVHEVDCKWILVSNEELNMERIDQAIEDDEIKKLWKLFFDTIAIKERTNPKLQRNNMPKRFWGEMVEKQ